MLINRVYKFRLYLIKGQEILINKTFRCTRLVYNHYLNKKQELYKEKNITLSVYEMIKDLSIRNYTCPKCGCHLDRNYNAALNIMYEGLKLYMKEVLV